MKYFYEKYSCCYSYFQIGEHSFTIEIVPDTVDLVDESFVSLRITTKSRNKGVYPYQTRCWTSVGKILDNPMNIDYQFKF